MSVTQATHTPPGLQTGDGALQSELAKQATHVLDFVLQMGVAPPHCEASVQPARHVKSCGLQTGFALPQSELERHSTHV